jgi:hypothetical protein
VVSSLHPLADSRHLFVNRNKPVEKGGEILPEMVHGSLNLWIITTYNEGYRGMGEVGQAFNNRFRTIRWGYDEAVEKQLITSPAIRLLGDKLRNARAGNKVKTPVGTRALQSLERDVAHFGIDLALDTFTGMFSANDLQQVRTIITDSSIPLMLAEEAKQAERNVAGNPDPLDPSNFLPPQP